ncbi:hypothetical protein F3Y22_tig00014213pilonHSYRG00152 [Hibiscus syriacus]|uniref:Uncharacterized protein n=1 Tax=Hibiscus syriacus TaxID=106335 RepID=A0A6A3C4Z2_HIBSY|nr:hypothetical protein F3Y22_tig00014213pilonHSYRG00152 [Hibiscus syriacus]
MDDYCKRSGQIPAFGEWDYANELPITHTSNVLDKLVDSVQLFVW